MFKLISNGEENFSSVYFELKMQLDGQLSWPISMYKWQILRCIQKVWHLKDTVTETTAMTIPYQQRYSRQKAYSLYKKKRLLFARRLNITPLQNTIAGFLRSLYRQSFSVVDKSFLLWNYLTKLTKRKLKSFHSEGVL